MEEEKSGITLREICRTIWLRKWVALIVAVAVALVCAISLYYGYNYRVKNYVMEFSLNLPGDDNGVVYIYPDGSQLYYTDMTSMNTLKAVKNTDEAFADIDVEEMATKGHINIERNIKVLVDDNLNASAYREITYTITAKASCFSSANQAKRFLAEVANIPADYLNSMEINYGVYLPLIEKAEDYEDVIGFLKNQLDDIQDKYDELIETYGGSFVIDENGKTLLAYSQELKAYNSSSSLNDLLTEARTNFYVKENSTVDYSLKKKELQNELSKANETLKKLESVYAGSESGSTVVLDTSVLKAQYDLIYDLNYQIEILDGYSQGTFNKEYDDKIQEAISMVEAFTDSYSATSAIVYCNASSVVYVQPGIIEVTGEMGLTKIFLLSVIIAVIVALIAAYVAGYYKIKALNSAKSTEESEPVNEEKTNSADEQNSEKKL
ncbi:MAG: hypothetical protein K2O89_05615 [Clostridia bacterium]|nr:hypothetical protein [Clostridia bacterium]